MFTINIQENKGDFFARLTSNFALFSLLKRFWNLDADFKKSMKIIIFMLV
jgi:hypothetical protein